MSDRMFSLILLTYVNLAGIAYHAAWVHHVNQAVIIVIFLVVLAPAYFALRYRLDKLRESVR